MRPEVPTYMSDEVVLGNLLLVIGGLRIVIAIANAEVFGAEATVAILMVVFGVAMRGRPTR
jgi:hypothetical protein